MKIDKVYDLETRDGHKIRAASIQKTLDFLETSKKFENSVHRIRNKFGIPFTGYSTKDMKGEGRWGYFEDSDINREFYFDCEELTRSVGLPRTWHEAIQLFVFANVFLPIPRKPMLFNIEKDENIPDGLFITIDIYERLTKKAFFKELEEYWSEIEELMGTVPNTKQHKMLRSNWAKRIVELRDFNKKKFREIADILESEANEPSEKEIITEDYVKILYNRWKKKIKK